MENIKGNIEKINIKTIIKKYNKFFIALAVMIVAQSIVSTYPIKLIGEIIDAATNISEGGVQGVLVLSLFFFIAHCSSGILAGALEYYTRKVENTIGHRIRCSIFNCLCNLPDEFFKRKNSSEILTRLIEDSSITTDGFIKPMVEILMAVCKFIVGLYMMINISWHITIILLPMGVVSYYIAQKTGGKFERNANLIRSSMDDMWKSYSEGIRGIREIKANCRTEDIKEDVEKYSERLSNNMIEDSKLAAKVTCINTTFFMGIIALIMAIGGVLLINKEITIGGLTSIMMYNGLLIDPIESLIGVYNELKKIKVSVERVNGILLEEREEDICEVLPVEMLKSINNIRFENISLNYGEKKALKEVSLCIRNSESVAIVGETGSGKSTMLNLIMGFLKPSSGTIYVNEKPITKNVKNIMRNITGIVFQDVFLFDDSIKNNIIFGNPNCSLEEYKKALRISKVDSIISGIIDGENTIVGENGSRLSGGERQRIGIARALVRNPKILILDEGTSALDNKTTEEIMKGIKREYNCTCIMVAHKLRSVSNCDQIYVMSNGEVVENGKHEELIYKMGTYKRMIELE